MDAIMRWCWFSLLAFVMAIRPLSAQAQEGIGMAAGRIAGTAAGMLDARPTDAPSKTAESPGLHWLDVGSRRPAALFVPGTLKPDVTVPLIVLLHGAGGDASGILGLMQAEAAARGVLLLAPQSDGATWDVIQGGYGTDVKALDRALHLVFERFAVDPEHVATAGFSDGASYALSIGLGNGDLFSNVLAFSPGFMAPGRISGQPRIFISHGTRDEVLPIDRCSRRIAPQLRRAGYDVDYREFDGPHVVPPDMVTAALDRFLRH
jgi:phospholipase/carboxylesterase